jgi:hypothetical protein
MKTIAIVRFEIRIDNPEEPAYLVGIDAEGKEYEWVSKAYVHGEFHDVETGIVCSEKV